MFTDNIQLDIIGPAMIEAFDGLVLTKNGHLVDSSSVLAEQYAMNWRDTPTGYNIIADLKDLTHHRELYETPSGVPYSRLTLTEDGGPITEDGAGIFQVHIGYPDALPPHWRNNLQINLGMNDKIQPNGLCAWITTNSRIVIAANINPDQNNQQIEADIIQRAFDSANQPLPILNNFLIPTSQTFSHAAEYGVARNIEPGTYMVFNKKSAIDSIMQMSNEIGEIQPSTETIDTLKFLDNAFAIYSGEKTFEEIFGIPLNNVEYAFTVPARGEYAAEAKQVLPIMNKLDPENNPRHKELFRDLLQKLPPFVLATYEDTRNPNGKNKPVGICLYSPQDLNKLDELHKKSSTPGITKAANTAYELGKAVTELKDIKKIGVGLRRGLIAAAGYFTNRDGFSKARKLRSEGKRMQEEASNSINETLAFVKRIAPGIKHAGLGAVLPGLTDLGNRVDINNLNIIPTTGHRITIYAMQRTMEEILKIDNIEQGDRVEIGIIGSGYIGASSADMFLKSHPNGDIAIYDINQSKARETAAKLNKKYANGHDRVRVVTDTTQLFNATNYIFSAATTQIDIPKGKVNLCGKVIIDDSEPSSFDPAELAAVGGTMVKPLIDKDMVGIKRVGLDYINRTRTEYDYGWIRGVDSYGPGLVDGAIFGCEAEAALAYRYTQTFGRQDDNPVLFYGRRVQSEDVEDIRRYCETFNFDVKPESLQGGGVLVYDKLVEGSRHRVKQLIPEMTT